MLIIVKKQFNYHFKYFCTIFFDKFADENQKTLFFFNSLVINN